MQSRLPGLWPGTIKKHLQHKRSLPLIELIQILELIRVIELVRIFELFRIIQLARIIELIRMKRRAGCRAFGPER